MDYSDLYKSYPHFLLQKLHKVTPKFASKLPTFIIIKDKLK
jgi:hypothetical protein